MGDARFGLDAALSRADLLESILDNTGEGLVAVDAAGRFTVFNPAARTIFGEGRLPEYSKNWPQNSGVYYPDQRTLVKFEDLPMARALRGESTDGAEFFIKNAAQPQGLSVSVTGRPLLDGAGRRIGGVVVLTDITKIKRAQERIEALNLELRRRSADLAQTNKDLEAFSYSVAHDLRAPLRAVVEFDKHLIKAYCDRLDEQGKDYLNRMLSGCRRMEQVIDDLLVLANVARKEVRAGRIDLSAVAASVIKRLREADPGRKVEFLSPPRLPVVADPGLLRMALENLIGNAWKFTGRTENARIELGVELRANEAVYFVKDNGAGFDMRRADKMFDAFQRLHSQAEFPGTGIGLAIVRRIMDRQGGRIWAEATEGKGAAFYFTLGGGLAS
ncbi:MAG: PAS domain S-box protein [Elusimicrobia bacterium]|nr:PAS domain S-box protein [Elusimicrobiota bacterium]